MKQCKEMVNFEERTVTYFAQEDHLLSFVRSSFAPIFQKSFDTASSISPSLGGCDHANKGVTGEISCRYVYINLFPNFIMLIF